jgi:hypothetical protein
MVAETVMMPDNPDEESDVRRLLDADQGLRQAVSRISEYGTRLFPDAELSLNTRQHDEWDPPLNLIIRAPYSDREEFAQRDRQFTSWLVHESQYDPGRLFVMVLPHNTQRRTT